ncbi:MAG TPA: ATP-binding protein [Actinomycetes bacterium]
MGGDRWRRLAALTARPWPPARRLLDRTPLRVKLIVAMLALVTVAATLISVAGIAVLRGYLVGRLDDQLGLVATRLADRPPRLPPAGFQDRGLGRLQPPSPFLVQFLDPDGNVEDAFDVPVGAARQPPRLPVGAAGLAASAGRPITADATAGAGRWRVLIARRDDGGFVVVAASLDETASTIERLQGIDLVVSIAVLLLLAAVGVATVRASLRPLVEIEQTAGAIAAGDLTRRVAERDRRTEVGRLGRAFNSMVAQIEQAFRARAGSEAAARWSEEAARQSEERMRRFVADASHELRTPLTAVRGFAELYRQGAARDPAELDRLMRRIEDQSARMGLLVEDLLLLARLDQQRPLQRRPVDLLALAADAVNDARALQPDRPIELQAGGDGALAGDGALVVLGDEPRLRQVVANLVANALSHTPAGSPVEVRARTARPDGVPHALLEVADHGPGLTREQAERVFERFYRADPARSHADGGSGLGLAIVAALVAAHGGRVGVDSAPGRGASFRVLLPLAPGAATTG